MSDSLIRQQPNPFETREESLTRQFYEWELRGRGWRVVPYPVDIEPPFRPFYLFDTTSAGAVDDGRRETFFTRLFDGLMGSAAASSAPSPVSDATSISEAQFAEADEPCVCDYYAEEFAELQLVLPKDAKVSKSVSEQLLLSLSYSSHPVSFEVVGTAEQIVVQMAATEKDLPQLKQQLRAHLPQNVVSEQKANFLTNAWAAGGDFSVIADFGLSHEFMLPLQSISSFETDPLVAVIGALSDLKQSEIGVFQVLFQRAKAPWAGEILDSVRFFDGTPFFVNAPEMIPLAREKVSRPLFAAIVRAAGSSFDEGRCWRIVRDLGACLAQFSNPAGNELIPLSNDGYDDLYHEEALLSRTSYRCGMLLNGEELVSLVHPPSPAVRSEKLVRESERTKLAPPAAMHHSLLLGENVHGSVSRRVTLSNEQRTKHIHLIGASGSGKSNLLLNLIKQDFEAGEGLCVIDPHGDLIDACLETVPENRLGDVVLFDPSDAEYPVAFNILQAKTELEKTLLSSDLVATFRRMSTSWGDVMDSVLANAILAFAESTRGGTLFDLKRFLVEKDFRRDFLATVQDDSIRYFWLNEFPLLAGKPQSSILIRLDAFLRQKLVRNIVCQRETRVNFRDVMDNRKILLVKLAQGAIGEENSHLLGTLIMSKLYQTALSRQDTRERPFFSCYLDEFHHFITPSMESVLSGVRKYNLGLVLAHQEFRQLQSRSQEVAASVLSNCHTRICFRLGDADAERFASGFSFFDAAGLQNLGVGEAVARIERAEYDFNLKTSPLPQVAGAIAEKRRAEIVARTRRRYAKPKTEVEAELNLTRIVQTGAAPHEPAAKSVKPIPPAGHTPKTEEKTKSESIEKSVPSAEKVGKENLSISSNLQSPVVSSKGVQGHRYLQSLVKRMAESKGFLVTIEKEVFGGAGKIDVALEDETRKIACEISVTNETDYELQNIRKCLAAGYSPVVVISADARHLGKIKKLAAENIAQSNPDEIIFFTPEAFHAWLEDLEKGDSKPAEKVKGFKVNVKLKPVDEKNLSTRKRAISDVVFGGLKKLKNKLDGK